MTQIPRERLVVGRYYVGRGRHSNVGQWEGRWFLVIGDKCGPIVKKEPYYDSDVGCFQPFLEIDEGTVIRSVQFGARTGWDAHYAEEMTFTVASCLPR